MPIDAELYEQKGKLVHRGREIALKAKEEKRPMTAEEVAECNTLDGEIRSTQAQIDTNETEARFASHLADLERVDNPAPRLTGELETRDQRAAGFYGSDEARSLFLEGFARGDISGYVNRSNEIDGGATTGAVLLPTDLSTSIERIIRDETPLLPIVRTRTSNAAFEIPRGLAFGPATWMDAKAAYGNPVVTFDKVAFSAYKLGALVPVTEEMADDDATELQSYLLEESGNAFSETIEEGIVNGSGSSQLTGFLANIAAANEVKATGAFDVDAPVAVKDLIRVQQKVKGRIRKNGSFVTSGDVITGIRLSTIGTDTNNFLWQPGLQAGQPDRLLGSPVYESAAMPDPDLATRIVVFGDFHRA